MSPKTSDLAKLKPRSPKAMGLTVMIVLLAFSLFAFNRPRVETTLSSGESLRAEFSQAYKLVPYQSVVKLAGVKVGTVTGVERTSSNGALVDLKLDNGTIDKLGTAPEANVRPTLVLGGTYYVELVRAGKAGSAAEGSTIPAERTTVPVELDRVLSSFTPSASEATKGTLASLERTFDRDGREEVRRFLASTPDALAATARVLDGLRGSRKGADLSRLVTGLQHTADAFTRDRSRLTTILDDLDATTAALAAARAPMAAAVASGPATLQATRTGLADLDATLAKLRTTADSFRPAARALGPVLAELDPILATARPVIADAREVARLARPLVQDLVPTAIDATSVLRDVRGPVLDRVTGPLTDAVLSPWHGTGVYAGGGNDHELYEEVGYLLSDIADVFKFHDHNGAHGRLMAGVGLSTPGGIIGRSLEEYLEAFGFQLPVGPQEGANPGEPAPPLGSSPSYGSSQSLGGLSLPGLPLLNLPLLSGSDR